MRSASPGYCINASNAEHLRPILESADVVFVHDPQPAALIKFFPNRKNKWVWRCHIDASNPNRAFWKFLRTFVQQYDASIFSLADFVQPLPHPIYLIPPSIDPLTEKNISLNQDEENAVYHRFGIDPDIHVLFLPSDSHLTAERISSLLGRTPESTICSPSAS